MCLSCTDTPTSSYWHDDLSFSLGPLPLLLASLILIGSIGEANKLAVCRVGCCRAALLLLHHPACLLHLTNPKTLQLWWWRVYWQGNYGSQSAALAHPVAFCFYNPTMRKTQHQHIDTLKPLNIQFGNDNLSVMLIGSTPFSVGHGWLLFIIPFILLESRSTSSKNKLYTSNKCYTYHIY